MAALRRRCGAESAEGAAAVSLGIATPVGSGARSAGGHHHVGVAFITESSNASETVSLDCPRVHLSALTRPPLKASPKWPAVTKPKASCSAATSRGAPRGRRARTVVVPSQASAVCRALQFPAPDLQRPAQPSPQPFRRGLRWCLTEAAALHFSVTRPPPTCMYASVLTTVLKKSKPLTCWPRSRWLGNGVRAAS